MCTPGFKYDCALAYDNGHSITNKYIQLVSSFHSCTHTFWLSTLCHVQVAEQKIHPRRRDWRLTRHWQISLYSLYLCIVVELKKCTRGRHPCSTLTISHEWHNNFSALKQCPGTYISLSQILFFIICTNPSHVPTKGNFKEIISMYAILTGNITQSVSLKIKSATLRHWWKTGCDDFWNSVGRSASLVLLL